MRLLNDIHCEGDAALMAPLHLVPWHSPLLAGFIMKNKHRINFLTATVMQPSNCTTQPYLSGILGGVSDCSVAVHLPLQRRFPAQDTAGRPDVG